ncbi:cell wall-binding repeat-containing protein [Leifsonia sp. ZF2019]|uniref:cell wall-binding repeat-containing protein n=1 Tax=Leifsonia sp. ZF2019 TaxID=2781978 RepID=UPI001CC15E0A|nr:cell wall-binding repeat-containing protein [Leifsonia sp. ZF2019]UAJ78936.1 cell wall-binding repeat-containing protein [Leifsonia sp. ZF2019]
MRIRPAAVTDQETTSPHRSPRRSAAALAVVALAAAGVVATAAVPAQATPGNGSFTTAYTTPVAGTVSDVAVDSYTSQVFAARPGGVDVIDEYSGAVVSTVGLGGSTNLRVEVDPVRAYAWVLDSSQSRLLRFDERTGNVSGSVTIPGNLRDLAVDQNTGTVFVTTGTTGTVVPVNASTVAAGTPLAVPGAANLIGVDPSAGTIYVATVEGAVAIIDESSFTVLGSVAGQASPSALTVDPAHHKAYIGSSSTSTLSVVDGSSRTTSTIALPGSYGPGVSVLTVDPATQTVYGQNAIQEFSIDTTTAAMNPRSITGTVFRGAAIDVFTNLIFVGDGAQVQAIWEPVSLLGTYSGVAVQGAPYSRQIKADGWGAVRFSITGGALPTGLRASGGTIVGTPSATGTYTFSLTATDDYNDSVTQKYTMHVVAGERVSGSDRFATSVAVSQAAYPDASTVGTVYVANGTSFPDALGGGPAAAHDSGPLLLTAPGSLPSVVSDEIKRLQPKHIVVVGGPAVVSDNVYKALGALTPDLKRVSGSDRFATARAVVANAFTSAPTVYVSTGLNFPDSLSAGAAAGSLHAPLLLVNGGAASVDADTAALLRSLGTSNIVIIGGTAVMSPSLAADFARFGTVTRAAGSDRWETSQRIVESAFRNSSRVILANGLNFPDALGASAWGGSTSSPLFISTASCVPQGVLDDTFFLGAGRVSLVGGEAALASSVAGLTSCGGWSVIAPDYPGVTAPTSALSGSAGDEAADSRGVPERVAPTAEITRR